MKHLCLPLLLLLCGCIHYRLGQKSFPRPFQRIYIAPPTSDVRLEKVCATLWDQLAQQIRQNPALQLVSKESAEVALEVHIRDLHQEIAASDEADSLRVNTYRVTLQANCSLRNLDTGEFLFQNEPTSAALNWQTRPSYSTAKRQSLPKLTRELAARITSLLLNFQP